MFAPFSLSSPFSTSFILYVVLFYHILCISYTFCCTSHCSLCASVSILICDFFACSLILSLATSIFLLNHDHFLNFNSCLIRAFIYAVSSLATVPHARILICIQVCTPLSVSWMLMYRNLILARFLFSKIYEVIFWSNNQKSLKSMHFYKTCLSVQHSGLIFSDTKCALSKLNFSLLLQEMFIELHY